MLADLIAEVARGARINRAAAGALHILGQVRPNIHFPQLFHKISCVVSFVGAYAHRSLPALSPPFAPALVEHQQRRLPFGGAIGLGSHSLYDQPVAVLHQNMAQVRQSGLLPVTLTIQTRLWIRLGLMRVVAALISSKLPR